MNCFLQNESSTKKERVFFEEYKVGNIKRKVAIPINAITTVEFEENLRKSIVTIHKGSTQTCLEYTDKKEATDIYYYLTQMMMNYHNG